MDTSPPSHQRFFAELKRRHVFRVMTVYGVIGFVLLQVVDLAIPALLLPEWTYRLVALLLLIGFPLAVILAWAFESTPSGVRRQRGADEQELRSILSAPASRRWPAGLLALGGAALLLWGAWHVGRTSADEATAATAATGTEAGGAKDDARSATLPEPAASIAVLPFVNMSADPEQDYFSDGISEELLNLLAHIPELQVAARTSSFAFKGQNLPITQIANSLNVEHVLEGSVRKQGDRVRITAQLIRADDGFHLWSDTWDRTLDDIFAIQDEIAEDVVRQLEVRLVGETPKVASTDPEAFDLALQARHLMIFGGVEDIERAHELYGRALAIDSTYGEARLGIATAILQKASLGQLDSEVAGDSAAALAREELARNPDSAGAYAILGSIAQIQGNDSRRAAENFERALAIDPTSHGVLRTATGLLRDIGRFDEAQAILDYLTERDPLNPETHRLRSNLARFTRRYDDVIRIGRLMLSINPDAPVAHYTIAMAFLLKDEPATALEEIAQEQDDEYRTKITAMAHYTLGNEAEHEAAFRELRERWGERWPSEIAQVYAYRGDADEAFEWLARAERQNEVGLDQQHAYQFYDPIRDDPRWDAFLERTGTSEAQLSAIDFEVPIPR